MQVREKNYDSNDDICGIESRTVRMKRMVFRTGSIRASDRIYSNILQRFVVKLFNFEHSNQSFLINFKKNFT